MPSGKGLLGGAGLCPTQPPSSILTPTPIIVFTPEPPQLWPEPAQTKGGCTLTWDVAQVQFSLGAEAMS